MDDMIIINSNTYYTKSIILTKEYTLIAIYRNAVIVFLLFNYTL